MTRPQLSVPAASPHDAMSSNNKQKRYIVSNVGYAWAVHDTQQQKTYYKDVDPSAQSGPKGRVVDICPNADTAYRIAAGLNATERNG